MKNRLIFLAFITALLTSCSSSAPQSQSSAPQAIANESQSYMEDAKLDNAISEPELVNDRMDTTDLNFAKTEQAQKKIILNGNLSMKANNLNDVIPAVENLLASYSGYIENSNTSVIYNKTQDYRVYNATLKIPYDNYNLVKDNIEGLAQIISYSEFIEDKTTQYYNLDSRLSIRKIEEERVLSLIDKAMEDREAKIEEIISLEERLSNIRTDVELINSQMNNINRLSAYSTLNLNITENPDIKPAALSADLGQKMKNSFFSGIRLLSNLFEALAIFISAAIAPVLLISIIIFSIILIRKRLKKS